MATFDAITDFQAETNPRGVWSYGYSEVGGTLYALIPFDQPTPGEQISWTKSDYNTSGTPAAWRNLGAAPAYGVGVGVGVGQLSLHPGPRPNGDFAILRFTAPRRAVYRFAGKFFAGDSGEMSARVVVRGDFDHPLQTFQRTTDDSVLDVPPQSLGVGDTVDFVVGNNGGYSSGNTPLSVTVTETSSDASTALVLSGGGARGDFQIGAIRYIYEIGKIPSILCGTSVGAINAIKLAEGENAANPMQGLAGLLKIWQSLKTNDDMYLAERWLFDPDMDPGLSGFLRGNGGALDVSGPAELGPAWGDLALIYNIAVNAYLLVGPGAAILKSLQVILTEARGLFNLSPISRRLATDCDPALIREWAGQGNQMRLATVSLDSGKLRYVTEKALLVERDGTPVVDPAGVAPACAGLASDLNTLIRSVESLRAEVKELQRQLQSAATGEKSALVTQIRGLGAQIAALATQIEAQRTKLSACAAANPQDFLLHDIRLGAVASASIPGIFIPVKIGSEYYIDGGIREVAPLQVAVDLGASSIYVVHASSAAVKPFVTPAQAGMVDIVSRSLADLTIDEIDRSDRLLSRGTNVNALNIVHIEPVVDLHSITTIDPGLIQIAHDYGYMRAADTIDSATGRRDALSTEIAQERLSIWANENMAEGKADPRHPGSSDPLPVPALLPTIEADKAELKKLIDERRATGGPMPPNIDSWCVSSELHPWLGDLVNDAAFVRQVVPASIPPQGTATVSVTMRNTGTTTWRAAKGFALGSQNPQDNAVWGFNRWPLERDVPPNAKVVFSHKIAAPPTGGAEFQWRMVQDGVAWFGASTAGARISVGPAVEPEVCARLRQQMVDTKQQIAELKEMMTGSPRNDAGLRAQIANLKRSLTRINDSAATSGCTLP